MKSYYEKLWEKKKKRSASHGDVLLGGSVVKNLPAKQELDPSVG